MIADRIRLARRKAGLSLRALSVQMQGRVTAQAIGKYERGEDVPSSGVLIALSKSLNVSMSYLLDSQSVKLSSRRIPNEGEYYSPGAGPSRGGGT